LLAHKDWFATACDENIGLLVHGDAILRENRNIAIVGCLTYHDDFDV